MSPSSFHLRLDSDDTDLSGSKRFNAFYNPKATASPKLLNTTTDKSSFIPSKAKKAVNKVDKEVCVGALEWALVCIN